MTKMNWGVLATGRIADKFAAALQYSASSDTLAVASRSITKAEKFAKKYGFKKAYGSYEELAKDPDVEVIYIATPMSCHYENAKMCLSHKKNVVLEKTVTINEAQFQELIDLARENQVFFMEAMWMKCHPVFQKAHEWIKEGRIGSIEMICADFCNEMNFDPEDRTYKKSLGGGALLDFGVYPITFATSFLGLQPEKIVSVARMGAIGSDFDDLILLQYKNATATLFCGFDIASNNCATIIGNKGRITFGEYFFCTDVIRLYDSRCNLLEEYRKPFECNGYEYEIREAEKCIREAKQESDLIPLSATMANLKIMDECRRQWGFYYEEEL